MSYSVMKNNGGAFKISLASSELSDGNLDSRAQLCCVSRTAHSFKFLPDETHYPASKSTDWILSF